MSHTTCAANMQNRSGCFGNLEPRFEMWLKPFQRVCAKICFSWDKTNLKSRFWPYKLKDHTLPCLQGFLHPDNWSQFSYHLTCSDDHFHTFPMINGCFKSPHVHVAVSYFCSRESAMVQWFSPQHVGKSCRENWNWEIVQNGIFLTALIGSNMLCKSSNLNS